MSLFLWLLNQERCYCYHYYFDNSYTCCFSCCSHYQRYYNHNADTTTSTTIPPMATTHTATYLAFVSPQSDEYCIWHMNTKSFGKGRPHFGQGRNPSLPPRLGTRTSLWVKPLTWCVLQHHVKNGDNDFGYSNSSLILRIMINDNISSYYNGKDKDEDDNNYNY